ncbi:dihydrolipoamide acetyltransferase family protein [Paracraurococcus lichenis]|uniref:Dihydrolipoamide acetyltransferase component of pyruvate dehydrogenase complex n=1 Tax=Paracraurococcus lichenis TaxID=3064888 RepID=A0ABT9ED39_9PROT|nr:dihydrolipoamide acetyltransferase family protein [Paracraurococcus sp. LOR1-02]MDO9714141.1 dihydrolipoamide acetyltransferase family protein [Paracraurococcus sp. LOR1-02]
MGTRVVKLPDIGEGVAEAELVGWHVKVGDLVREEQPLAEVMTDKATVEIPSPVGGTILALGGEVGSTLAVGGELVRIEVPGQPDGAAAPAPGQAPAVPAVEQEAPTAKQEAPASPQPAPPPRPAARQGVTPRLPSERPIASPAVRLRAREAGIDLRQLRGSGPAGRILHEDLDALLRDSGTAAPATAERSADTRVEEIKVTGLRRRIAERMAEATRRIAHFSYVEEVDLTALEELRAALNAEAAAERPKLTLLPFLMLAVVRAVADFPQMNALYDDEAGVIRRHGGVHLGIATQTPSGLVVPVVRHAEARDLWECAAELKRLSEAARAGQAARDELGGSTITITSLGALGGIASTPVVNWPEVAIIGVNRMAVRPMWIGGGVVPRKMMNLSSSFDHRVIDGYDAAAFIQRIKSLLELPARIFIGG